MTVKEIGAQFAIAALFGSLIGAGGVKLVRMVSKFKPEYAIPVTTACVGAGVSCLSRKGIEHFKVGEKLKARFGERYQHEEICFMASTFFLTGLLTYKLGPKITKKEFHLIGTACHTVVTTSGAIIALLFTTDTTA
ncbi:MAG: hypothetical protein KDK64_06905 [Chlamydiia bacterium]|nr:hypothetical protein [Chlamydiia bacterium]